MNKQEPAKEQQPQLQAVEEFVPSVDGQLSPSQLYDLDSFPSALSPTALVESRYPSIGEGQAVPVGSPSVGSFGSVGRKISAPPANKAMESKRPLNVNFYHIHGNTISITPAGLASQQQTPTPTLQADAEQKPNSKPAPAAQVQMMALFAKDKSVCSTDEEDEAGRRARQAACWPRFLRCSGSNKQCSTPYLPPDKAPLAMDPLVAPLRDVPPSVDREEHCMRICAWPFSKAFIDPLDALRTLEQQSFPSASAAATASSTALSSSKLSRHASDVGGARDDLEVPSMIHMRAHAAMAQSASLYTFNSPSSSGVFSPQTQPPARQSSELYGSCSSSASAATARRLQLAEIRPSSTAPLLSFQSSRAPPIMDPIRDSSGRGISPIYEPVSVDVGSLMGPVLTPFYQQIVESSTQQPPQPLQQQQSQTSARTRSTTGSRSPSSAASSSSASLTSFAAAGSSPHLSSSAVARAASPHRTRLPTGSNAVPKTLTSIAIDQPPLPIPRVPTSLTGGAALPPYSPQISTKQIDDDDDIL